MYMTAEEKINMLEMIKDAEELNTKKNQIIDQIIAAAQVLAQENYALKIEMEKMKRHLSLAEGTIERYRKQEEVRKRVAELNEAGSSRPDDHRAHFNQGWNT